MMTPKSLAETLCQALGLNPDLGTLCVEYLAAHGMFGENDAENAAKLLIALAASGEASAPHKTVERYWNLPLDRVDRSTLIEAGMAHDTLPDDDLFVRWCRLVGDDLGSFLTAIIDDYTRSDQVAQFPGSFVVGGGPGMTSAFVGLIVPVARDDGALGASVHFTLDAYGGGIRPDDAPRARMERYAQVPDDVFQVLREAMSGRDDKPERLPPMENAAERFQQFVEGME